MNDEYSSHVFSRSICYKHCLWPFSFHVSSFSHFSFLRSYSETFKFRPEDLILTLKMSLVSFKTVFWSLNTNSLLLFVAQDKTVQLAAAGRVRLASCFVRCAIVSFRSPKYLVINVFLLLKGAGNLDEKLPFSKSSSNFHSKSATQSLGYRCVPYLECACLFIWQYLQNQTAGYVKSRQLNLYHFIRLVTYRDECRHI
jgi:hypothetical protein